MKRTLTFVCCLLAVGIAFSQKVAKNEVKALQSFLAQPSAKGGTNAHALLPALTVREVLGVMQSGPL